MRLAALTLTALASSMLGCPHRALLADRERCHLAAEETTVVAWCQSPTDPNGVQKCEVRVIPNDRVCPQELFGKRP